MNRDSLSLLLGGQYLYCLTLTSATELLTTNRYDYRTSSLCKLPSNVADGEVQKAFEMLYEHGVPAFCQYVQISFCTSSVHGQLIRCL